MSIKSLRDKLRTAEVSKDIDYAVQALEDYFQDDPSIDLWWFRIKIEELLQFSGKNDELNALLALADIKSISELEPLVLAGLDSSEYQEEKVEELRSIKRDLAALYTKLLTSLT